YLADRWADEDRTQTARGYLLFDFTARYRYKWIEAFFSIENLTNTDWREAQFFFTSRLAGEPAAGVPDIHYTAGSPRSFTGGSAVRFYPPHPPSRAAYSPQRPAPARGASSLQ